MIMLVLMTGLAPGAAAQVNTVDLTVMVLDPQEAAVPDAEIRVRNLGTGSTRAAAGGRISGRCLIGSRIRAKLPRSWCI